MSKHTFFPYRAQPGGIKLQLKPVDTQLQVDAGGRIRAYGTDALELVLDVIAAVPDEVYRRTLAPQEQTAPPVAITLVLRGTEARRRQSLQLPGNRDHRGSVSLQRRDWYGTIEVQAFLVRTAANLDLPVTYARDRGAILASSDVTEILFDEPPTPPTGGLLNFKWEDFAQSQRSWLRQQGENLFALDVNVDPPVVYLNRGLEGAVAILGSGATHGRKARIRDLTFNLIAHQVWTSLLGTALTSLAGTVHDTSEDTPGLNELPQWQQSVIREWVQQLCPGENTREEAQERLYEILRTSTWTRDLLLQRIPEVVQRRFNMGRRFTQLATEAWES